MRPVPVPLCLWAVIRWPVGGLCPCGGGVGLLACGLFLWMTKPPTGGGVGLVCAPVVCFCALWRVFGRGLVIRTPVPLFGRLCPCFVRWRSSVGRLACGLFLWMTKPPTGAGVGWSSVPTCSRFGRWSVGRGWLVIRWRLVIRTPVPCSCWPLAVCASLLACWPLAVIRGRSVPCSCSFVISWRAGVLEPPVGLFLWAVCPLVCHAPKLGGFGWSVPVVCGRLVGLCPCGLFLCPVAGANRAGRSSVPLCLFGRLWRVYLTLASILSTIWAGSVRLVSL